MPAPAKADQQPSSAGKGRLQLPAHDLSNVARSASASPGLAGNAEKDRAVQEPSRGTSRQMPSAGDSAAPRPASSFPVGELLTVRTADGLQSLLLPTAPHDLVSTRAMILAPRKTKQVTELTGMPWPDARCAHP